MTDDVGGVMRSQIEPGHAPAPDLAAIRRRGRQLRRRKLAAATLGGAALAGTIAVVAAAGLTADGPERNAPPPVAAASSATQGAAVAAEIIPRRVGGVEVRVTEVRQDPGDPSTMRHEIELTNHGDRPALVRDFRTSVLLPPEGRPRLLVADEGCGYGRDDAGELEAGPCALLQDDLLIPAGESVRREIRLLTGLEGMGDLAPGEYRHDRRLVVETETGSPGGSATFTFTYRVS